MWQRDGLSAVLFYTNLVGVVNTSSIEGTLGERVVQLIVYADWQPRSNSKAQKNIHQKLEECKSPQNKRI